LYALCSADRCTFNHPIDPSLQVLTGPACRIHKTKAMNAKEYFTTNGENLLKKVEELIEEGNIRKITITDKDGKELMSFPLTIGVVGAMFAPILAAVGALAALIGECSITVEREK
jgi:hypothetical protein